MKPLTRQRSSWAHTGTLQAFGMPVPADQHHRPVHDGTLMALVADEPQIGWHMSISFRDHRGRPSRYPTWDELAHARYELLPAHLDFVMHLPPLDNYVAVMDTCFHLHQHPAPEVGR